MRWIKRGKIFDPTQHKLNFPCNNYAQSPQVLVFDDFYRIYFSTREKDGPKYFLSQVYFIDFDKKFKEIVNYAKKPVIELGGLGTFDEHGIFPFNIIRHKKQIWAYTCGWSRRESVSVETSTGLVVSNDNGVTFERIGDGPILTSSLEEPFLVGDSFVKKYNDQFYMWYIFGKKWLNDTQSNSPERIYKITHALSSDGITWQNGQGYSIIPDHIGEQECQALPTVVKIQETYHMYFCYRFATDFRNNPEKAYRLGYAYSNDLHTWTRDNEYVGIERSEDGWDSEMICYPHVFSDNSKVYMLYNGNQFGKYGFGLAELDMSTVIESP